LLLLLEEGSVQTAAFCLGEIFRELINHSCT